MDHGVAFSSSHGENRNQLLLVGTQGGQAEVYNVDAQVLAWSPDSRSLLIDSGREFGAIRLLDIDSRRLIDILPKLAGPQSYGDVKVSPDGRWLALTISIGSNRAQVFITPFRRQLLTRDQWNPLTDDTKYRHDIAWSLDGKLLYWFSVADGKDCIYAQRLSPSKKDPAGAPFPVYRFNGKLHVSSFYRFYMQFNANKILLPMADSSSNVWMTKLPDNLQ